MKVKSPNILALMPYCHEYLNMYLLSIPLLRETFDRTKIEEIVCLTKVVKLKNDCNEGMRWKLKPPFVVD